MLGDAYLCFQECTVVLQQRIHLCTVQMLASYLAPRRDLTASAAWMGKSGGS